MSQLAQGPQRTLPEAVLALRRHLETNRANNPTASGLNNLYLAVRHGFAGSNAEEILVSSPAVDCQKYGMRPEGYLEIIQQAENISTLVMKSLAIFQNNIHINYSPLLRTTETATTLRHTINAEWAAFRSSISNISSEPDLIERCWGELDGQHHNKWHDVRNVDQHGGNINGLESSEAFLNRIASVILKRERQHGQIYIFSTHCDVIQGLKFAVSDLPIATHYSEVGEIKNGEFVAFGIPATLGRAGNGAQFPSDW